MTFIIPGIEGFPLGLATKLRCKDPAQLEQTVSSLIEPRRLMPRHHTRRLDIRVSHVDAGLGHLFGVSHGGALRSTSSPILSYQVMIPLRGALIGRLPGGEILASQGSALVYSPGDSLDTLWSDNNTSLLLSIPAGRVRSIAEDTDCSANAQKIRLQPHMNLRDGIGRSFAYALGAICQESQDPTSAFRRGLTARLLEQTLLTSLLWAQQDDAPPPVNPARHAYLERALAYIDAYCDNDIGNADIARAAGVSLRSLQYSFMERFAMGPAAYLRQTRLRRVRAALNEASPGAATVGDIAARWGFYSGSAFTRSYQKMFGELPSRTLANPPTQAKCHDARC